MRLFGHVSNGAQKQIAWTAGSGPVSRSIVSPLRLVLVITTALASASAIDGICLILYADLTILPIRCSKLPRNDIPLSMILVSSLVN